MSLGMTHVFDLQNSVTGDHTSIYRCEECGALVENENTDRHLDWHRTNRATQQERYDLLRKVERTRWLHDRLAKSPNDRAHYFAGLLRRALEDQ